MYVEAPLPYDGVGPAVFLAGGITGCPDWQSMAAKRLLPHADILNPRRREYVFSPEAEDAEFARQVEWEYTHLRRADVVMFWFAAGAVQPIALFELGAFAGSAKPIVVGADPAYPRRTDVRLQLGHARPGLTVHSSLESTIDAVLGFIKS
jgi:hypothetical protein